MGTRQSEPADRLETIELLAQLINFSDESIKAFSDLRAKSEELMETLRNCKEATLTPEQHTIFASQMMAWIEKTKKIQELI